MKFPLVHIRWTDVVGGNRTGWKGLADITANLNRTFESVGFLVKETPESYIVVPHWGDEFLEGDGEIVIFKAWVADFNYLLKTKRKPKKPAS